MSDKASLMQKPAPLADVGLQREIANLFVQALNLEVAPQEIDPDAPLYGEGLGLDSIDIWKWRSSSPSSTAFNCAPTARRISKSSVL
jgi:hypothetical protein